MSLSWKRLDHLSLPGFVDAFSADLEGNVFLVPFAFRASVHEGLVRDARDRRSSYPFPPFSLSLFFSLGLTQKAIDQMSRLLGEELSEYPSLIFGLDPAFRQESLQESLRDFFSWCRIGNVPFIPSSQMSYVHKFFLSLEVPEDPGVLLPLLREARKIYEDHPVRDVLGIRKNGFFSLSDPDAYMTSFDDEEKRTIASFFLGLARELGSRLKFSFSRLSSDEEGMHHHMKMESLSFPERPLSEPHLPSDKGEDPFSPLRLPRLLSSLLGRGMAKPHKPFLSFTLTLDFSRLPSDRDVREWFFRWVDRKYHQGLDADYEGFSSSSVAQSVDYFYYPLLPPPSEKEVDAYPLGPSFVRVSLMERFKGFSVVLGKSEGGQEETIRAELAGERERHLVLLDRRALSEVEVLRETPEEESFLREFVNLDTYGGSRMLPSVSFSFPLEGEDSFQLFPSHPFLEHLLRRLDHFLSSSRSEKGSLYYRSVLADFLSLFFLYSLHRSALSSSPQVYSERVARALVRSGLCPSPEAGEKFPLLSVLLGWDSDLAQRTVRFSSQVHPKVFLWLLATNLAREASPSPSLLLSHSAYQEEQIRRVFSFVSSQTSLSQSADLFISLLASLVSYFISRQAEEGFQALPGSRVFLHRPYYEPFISLHLLPGFSLLLEGEKVYGRLSLWVYL